MTDSLCGFLLFVAFAVACAVLCIGLPFLMAFAITDWIPLRNAKRELDQGDDVDSVVYQWLRSYPDDWSVVTDDVYGDLVMHNVEDVGVQVKPCSRQCSIIVGYRKNGVGRFLRHDFHTGVALAGRVSEWNRRKK